ncbi:hypothetical protein [Chitinophaga polysaccharea]|uniref:hypothetical protein n=1 Tax=Chitinophaga polysaccharea TaxID=1293035 RepID=UPI0016469292|nr:hypothetical protein [Chitinophaga polysaccharea]
MCNKRALSKADAQQALYWIRSNKRRKGMRKRKECRHYWCDECNAFHLTSKGKQDYHG